MGGETIKSLCNKLCIKYHEKNVVPFIVWSMDIYQFNLYYVTLMPKAQRHYSFQRDNLSCRV